MGRDGCRLSGREIYNVGVLQQHKASRLWQYDEHRSVSPMLDSTERCETVRDAGICCSSVEVREGALVSSRGTFNINGCL